VHLALNLIKMFVRKLRRLGFGGDHCQAYLGKDHEAHFGFAFKGFFDRPTTIWRSRRRPRTSPQAPLSEGPAPF